MTLQKFNDKDLLRNIRTGVLNPMVDQTNANTLDVNTLKGRVSGIDKRVGLLEPEVKINTTNLAALNQFAQAVAQQVSLSYDKSTVDVGRKHLTFTTIGGSEKTLDLSPMFVDPIRTTISVKGPTESNYHEMSRLDFEGNVKITYDNTIIGSETATITIDPMKGSISGNNPQEITEIEIKGNVGSSSLLNKKLTIDIPKGGSGTVSNSMFMDPNPPQAGKNFFEGITKDAAEVARDAYFATTAGAEDLKTYDANVFKIILVEWDNGPSGNGDKLLQFQCRHNSSWVNPFHMDFSSFALGKHYLTELKDADRITKLESETINKVESIGTTGAETFNVESGRTLQLRKLKSENEKDLTISVSGSQDVAFRTNQHWRGSYASKEEASTNIQQQDRIADRTTIITKNDQSEDAVHVWDGSNWVEKKISEHAVISVDNQNYDTLKGLKHGTHISFTKDSSGYHTIEALSPIIGKVGTGTESRINKIEVSNQFATFEGGILKLPVISAMNENSEALGQVKNIKSGDNVTFERDSNGVVTIKSAITPVVKVKKGTTGQSKNLTLLTDPTNFSILTDDGELTLPGLGFIQSDGADKGYIKNLKPGNNILMDKNGDGTLTISSTGGGGVDVIVSTGTSGDEVVLTKIKVPNEYSTVDSTGVLTLHSVDFVGDAGATQGYIKSIRSGDNTTLTLNTDGVLQINATGGGGGTGGTIQAQVDGGTGLQNITAIEALKSPAIIENGILKLKPIEFKRPDGSVVITEGVKVVQAGVGIGFSKEADGSLHINNEGRLKSKIKYEDGTSTDLKLITQIDFTSDRTHGSIPVSDDGILKLDTRGFPAGASTLEELKSKFPVSDNAYRHGYVGTTKDMYFAHSEAEGWKLHNYFGMADEVKSLNSRFPVTTSTAPGTYDSGEPVNKIYYVEKVNCPIAASEYKEYGIVKDIVATKTKRSQMFYGLQTGNIWSRIMKPTTTSGEDGEFLEWNLLNGLSEDHYSILTIPSLKVSTSKNEINGTTQLPWMVMQDPKCNVSIDSKNNSLFHINKSGVYDIAVCIHVTSNPDANPPNTGAGYTMYLKNHTTGDLKVESTTFVKPADKGSFNAGMYPPVRLIFKNVSAIQGNQYSLRVSMSRYPNLTNIYLDSFKNYLVVQPSASNTKQGIVIADNWRTALGGFSNKNGYEIHVEGLSESNPSTVRVFGTVLNTKLHIG